jgi:hypothetical protein
MGAMALHFVATRPDPALFPMPWDTPLEEWDERYLVPLPRGLSRHIVRIIRTGPGGHTYVAKETQAEMAHREYRVLRDLGRVGLPVVVPQCVVTGRETPDGEELPAMLVTRHLQFSMPYRWLFSHGLDSAKLPSLIDALVVLLVRLHLANFFWGDVSLSNVLFRRSAGEFAAYLVDAETGELRPSMSEQMREYDLTIAYENVFAEMLDLIESGDVHASVDPHQVIDRLQEQYAALWSELTSEEEFGSGEMWRVEQRIQRLNDLGFDVDEIEMDSTGGGERMLLRPKVVELGHHSRELQALTGLSVEENQARRLLNDLAAFTHHFGMQDEEPTVTASRWMTKVYEPIMAMVPAELRGKLEPAEIFHEILDHRWYLSERAGREVGIFDSARDYIAHVLPEKPRVVPA